MQITHKINLSTDAHNNINHISVKQYDNGHRIQCTIPNDATVSATNIVTAKVYSKNKLLDTISCNKTTSSPIKIYFDLSAPCTLNAGVILIDISVKTPQGASEYKTCTFGAIVVDVIPSVPEV